MISGATSPESILPGSPASIAQAVETVGAGVSPARAVTSAWQAMSLPQWQGSAASSWDSFVPREAACFAKAPAAFSQVASALLAYQSAFISARAEIAAAIRDAAASEQATAGALQQHRDATRKAALAEPGTPEAVVGAFFDPGAMGLANAQTRAQAAVTAFNTTGDEVASQIRAAAAQTSDEKPGIEWWEQILRFPDTFIWNGVGGQLIDTLVGVWEMLPVHYMFDDWFNGGEPWWEQYGELWGGIIDAIVSDPLGALEAMWLDFIAAEHWDEYAGEGTGRVFTNVVMLLAGGVGAVRILRNLKNLRRADIPAALVNKPPASAIHVDRTKPGGNLFPEDFDPWGGLTYEQYIAKHWNPEAPQWDGSLGGWKYPDNDGFDTSPGAQPRTTITDMPVGTTRFDRFGGTGGEYVSPPGTPFPERGLPPDSVVKEYHVYKLEKEFDDFSGYPEGGSIAPAFEQPGGGYQIKLPKSIFWLLKHGYISEVPQ